MLIKLKNKKTIKTNPDRSLIRQISKSGRSFFIKGIKTKFLKAEAKKLNICISISKKIVKSAVRRNYIKRRIRSGFCEFVSSSDISGYSFYIIVLSKEISGNFAKEFEKEFEKIKDRWPSCSSGLFCKDKK